MLPREGQGGQGRVGEPLCAAHRRSLPGALRADVPFHPGKTKSHVTAVLSRARVGPAQGRASEGQAPLPKPSDGCRLQRATPTPPPPACAYRAWPDEEPGRHVRGTGMRSRATPHSLSRPLALRFLLLLSRTESLRPFTQWQHLPRPGGSGRRRTGCSLGPNAPGRCGGFSPDRTGLRHRWPPGGEAAKRAFGPRPQPPCFSWVTSAPRWCVRRTSHGARGSFFSRPPAAANAARGSARRPCRAKASHWGGGSGVRGCQERFGVVGH